MTHIARQKIYFSVIAGCLALAIGTGTIYARNIDFKLPSRTIDAFLDRAEYARFGGAGALQAIFSVFGSPDALASATETEDGVPVLLYHGIVNGPDRFSMTTDTFKDQLYTLKAAGYQTISLEDYYAFQRGEKRLPRRSFLLTFDDGRRDSYEKADPVLKALGFKAVMFIATADSVPAPSGLSGYYITTSDIKEMVASGNWEIGSHDIQSTGGFVPVDGNGTRGNFLSNKAWLPTIGRLETDDEYFTRITSEIVGSKHVLESNFGVQVDATSYPFGDYGQQTVNNPGAISAIASLEGDNYRVAFRQVWQNQGEYILNYSTDNRLRLKRIEVPTDWTGAQLLAYLEGGLDKSLPYADDFAENAGWRRSWGDARIANGDATLGATSTTTGAAAFLDGTKTWKDYRFDATLDWTSGSNVTLMSRYKDGQNYLSCIFGTDGWVAITSTIDGATQRIFEQHDPVALANGRRTSLGMSVQGRSATCYAEGEAVASTTVPDGIGGVGFKIWDPRLATAEIHVKNVSLTPLK